VAQQRGGPREPRGRRLWRLVEEADRFLEPGHDALGVLQPAALGAQVVLLVVSELHRVDLGELEAVEILLTRALAHLLPESSQGRASVLPCPDERSHALADRKSVGE